MKLRALLGLSFIILALAPTTATLCAAGESPASPDKAVLTPTGAGWQPIFNNRNLEGWKAETNFWKIETNGVMHGYTPGEKEHHYCWSEKTYGDFDARRPEAIGNNSGICIRIAPVTFDNVPGYQVDMGDGYWGCLWEEHGRGMVVKYSREDADKLVHKEEWNHYYIRAQGHHLEAWLNGVKTIDVVDDKGPLSGPIGFQLCHGVGKITDVSFRNVLLRPLKKD
jgi:Domain of Unknown Function (DUF1080).